MFVILGPTSSGKSDYAIRLAKKLGGEIVSVDSRQVYRGMDIGTGKIPMDFTGNYKLQITNTKRRNKDLFYSEGVRHHLLDVASPKRDYNVTHFLRDATKAIADIERRGSIPILCGGTAFWIEALLFGTTFPAVKPDKKFREKLEKLPTEELFAMLETKDPERAGTIDAKNKVRLIRALEIVEALGKVPSTRYEIRDARYKSAKIFALSPPKEILHARIEKRLEERLEKGMIDEVKRLREEGVSWKRLEGFGLEYRWCARYLQGKVSGEAMEAELLKESRHYAKRQLTFLRRLERIGLEIEWVTESPPEDLPGIPRDRS